MARIIFGIFIALHGLVHLLYFGQSRRLFELQPGMKWPDESWIFSKLNAGALVRDVASLVLVLVAAGLVAGGIGVLARQAWSRWVVVAALALSSLLYLAMWDGTGQHLDQQGGIAILIAAAIALDLLVVRWPAIE
jgi:hypothetical protein